ncbi:MAG: siphovirus ReqiPepy6 Gp37-like family protein [Ruminococcus sp.]|nr:siphovirus ReqiPepy6 Gp37-like family protein [Ruminococcus sp.]
MKEIYVLNRNLERIGIIDDYTSLIWADRYSEIGDCELYTYVSAELLNILRKNNYLIREDDDMICRIETIEINTDVENGNYLTVTGYDCKKILNQRIIWGQSNAEGNVESHIRDIVYKSLINPDLPERAVRNADGRRNFLLGEKAGFTEITTGQASYRQIGERIQEYCKLYGWGYKVTADNGNFYFSLYKGTDRSDSVIFSNDFENLISTRYSEDSGNMGNVALVAGEGNGSERSRNVSGYAESLDRYEIYVDARDISRTITWNELIKMYPDGHIQADEFVRLFYVMNIIDIQIVDENQLERLRSDYPDGRIITKDGTKYYQAYNVIIADLENDSPAENDSVILRDVVYSVYLLNRGYDKLSEYGTVVEFEGSIEPDSTFVYKQDYFLGDLVTVENEYGISRKARIVEVVETNDENGCNIEPKFEYIEVN